MRDKYGLCKRASGGGLSVRGDQGSPLHLGTELPYWPWTHPRTVTGKASMHLARAPAAGRLHHGETARPLGPGTRQASYWVQLPSAGASQGALKDPLHGRRVIFERTFLITGVQGHCSNLKEATGYFPDRGHTSKHNLGPFQRGCDTKPTAPRLKAAPGRVVSLAEGPQSLAEHEREANPHTSSSPGQVPECTATFLTM